ncbi:uncharacterized protein sowahb [Stigmatopora argus]
MDADFTQDSVLHFLQSKGGSVKNAELLHHFKGFLREHADQVRNRELFKMFVNCVATVKQEHGVSHVVLRKKFRVPAPIVGGDAIFGTSDRGSAEPPPPKSTLNPAWSRDKLRQKAALPEATIPTLPRESDVKIVLPAAGIMLNNNNNNVETNLNRRPKALPVLTHAPILDQTRPEYPIPRQIHAQAGQQKVSDQPRAISQQVPPPRSPKGPQEPLGGLDMKPKHSSLAVVQPRRVRHRQSYKTAVSYDEDEDEEPNLKLAAGPPGSHQGHPNASSSTEIPTIHVHDMANAGRLLHSRPGWSPESVFQPRAGQDALPECPPGGSVPTRRSLPAPLPERTEDEDRRYSQPVGVALANRKVWSATEKTWMSGSHDSILTSPSDAGFPGSDWPAGRHGSTEMQDLTAGASMDALKTLEVPQRPPDPRLSAPWHHSTGTLPDKRASAHVAPLHKSSDHLNRQLVLDETQWRHSSGNLYDDHESSDCSASSPARRLSPTRARRGGGGGKLSGRMCRSMGADLDRLLREEAEEGARGNEAARRKRLHRISSSLSLHYNLSSSSLSSCNSLADLAEAHADAKGKRVPLVTGARHESPNKESQVPLDGREHEWLVKGASGAWPDIYSLFREDATLLHRRDFISGFTVLHWIAKHGDHRVLNTLWYGVQKAGLALDINAKASCGQTPLHIAAVHGHKNMIRLLVNKFNADVELRDTAGKKPWQYLNTSESQEVFHLLGAPARGAAGVPSRSPAAEGHAEEKPRQRRRHRRHHLSFASRGEKPKIVSGSKVKRSSSIAAFLKQNPLSRFHGYKSDG